MKRTLVILFLISALNVISYGAAMAQLSKGSTAHQKIRTKAKPTAASTSSEATVGQTGGQTTNVQSASEVLDYNYRSCLNFRRNPQSCVNFEVRTSNKHGNGDHRQNYD